MGAHIINSTAANSVGACCSKCDDDPECNGYAPLHRLARRQLLQLALSTRLRPALCCLPASKPSAWRCRRTRRWTYCPASEAAGCLVPTGPHANRTVPAGTCLTHNNVAPSNRLVRLEWSWFQPTLATGKNRWLSGTKAASSDPGQPPQIMEDTQAYWGEGGLCSLLRFGGWRGACGRHVAAAGA